MMKKILFVMLLATAFATQAQAECKKGEVCELKKGGYSSEKDCDECKTPSGLPRCCNKDMVCSDSILKMDKELKLSADQKKKLAAISRETNSKNAALKKKIAAKWDAVMKEGGSQKPNQRTIEKLIREKYDLKADMMINKMRSHMDATAVLTPEQVAKLAPKGKKK